MSAQLAPPSTSTARQVRHQQRIEELCACAVRALSGDPELIFRGGRLHRGTRPYPASAPHLRPSPGHADFGSFRGAADALALRRLHSDPDLHRRLQPEGKPAALVFEMLEQFRVESLAPSTLAGVRANLRHRHLTWSRDFHSSGLTETATGILLFTVAQICRARVTGEPVLAETEHLVEATRAGVVATLGEHLARLRGLRHDQAGYAVPARAISEQVSSLIAEREPELASTTTSEPRNGFSLFLDAEEDTPDPVTAVSGDSRTLAEAPDGYRVFTRAYDRVVTATRLVRAARLEEQRRRLDERVAEGGVNVARLALQLRTLLAEPVHDGWSPDHEEGRVDGRRLAQLVTSPTERRLFYDDRFAPVADCLVTFLVDCSGSMRRHHGAVATLLDVLLRALDLVGVSSELLGFTTGAWNGGRPMRDWRRAGRPGQPGRLNELCHLVFKDADTPWRRARRGVAALLTDDVYREGVDGEAMLWALDRMSGRPERRRILIVVSDGSPMDSATNLANDPQYLDHHLRQVVAEVEETGRARVYGLGVGLDLSPFYRESVVLDIERSRTPEMVRDVLGLLAGYDRR